MTDKRFVKTHRTINWWAVLDNGKELLEDEVVELLNELYEENEQLKKDVEYYKTERLFLFEYLDKKDDLELELKVVK